MTSLKSGQSSARIRIWTATNAFELNMIVEAFDEIVLNDLSAYHHVPEMRVMRSRNTAPNPNHQHHSYRRKSSTQVGSNYGGVVVTGSVVRKTSQNNVMLANAPKNVCVAVMGILIAGSV